MDFKIAVCDDEAYFRDRIKELLQKYFAEKGLSVSIDLYESGASFCSDPDNFKAYDVVFLDIEGTQMYMYGQINDLQKQLADFSFIRPHQSFLVNLKYIDRIRNYTIYMTNGMEIPVTKPRYVEVKEKFFDIFLKRKYASL